MRPAKAQLDAVAANPKVFDQMSFEMLPLLDGDIIFFSDYTLENGGADETFINDEVLGNPLFQNLRGVKEGILCRVPGGRWNEGSVLAANAMLNDVEACLLKE